MSATPPQQIIRSSYSSSDTLQAREFVEEAYGARIRAGAVRDATCPITLERLRAGGIEFADLRSDLRHRRAPGIHAPGRTPKDRGGDHDALGHGSHDSARCERFQPHRDHAPQL